LFAYQLTLLACTIALIRTHSSGSSIPVILIHLPLNDFFAACLLLVHCMHCMPPSRCPFCNALTPCGSQAAAGAAALKINFAMIELLQVTDSLTAELSALAAGAVKPALISPYAGQGPACQNCGEGLH